jgi:hypothetical protein
MIHDLLGWMALGFFILSCSYSLFKRLKNLRLKINFTAKKLLDYHCIFAIIALIIAFIHAGSYLSPIKFSTGYISLLLMILLTLVGILMKYFKKIYMKHKMGWLYTHIILATMLAGTILLHILTYLLLQ